MIMLMQGTQVNLLGKLPAENSSDPLAMLYTIDLTVPADRVVSGHDLTYFFEHSTFSKISYFHNYLILSF